MVYHLQNSDDLTEGRITANLRRYASHGIDAHNPDHREAYKLVRCQTNRVTPERLLRAIGSKVSTSGRSTTLTGEFYLVPEIRVDKKQSASVV